VACTEWLPEPAVEAAWNSCCEGGEGEVDSVPWWCPDLKGFCWKEMGKFEDVSQIATAAAEGVVW